MDENITIALNSLQIIINISINTDAFFKIKSLFFIIMHVGVFFC